MLLVEKVLRSGATASIKLVDEYDENDKKTGRKLYRVFSILKKDTNAYQANRVGTKSVYGAFLTLKEAQSVFERKFGLVESKDLRGKLKTAKLQQVEKQKQKKCVVVSTVSGDTILDIPSLPTIPDLPKTNSSLPLTLPEEPTKVEKVTDKANETEKVFQFGVLDSIRIRIYEAVYHGITEREDIRELLCDDYKQSSLTRVLNQIFGKPEKVKKEKIAVDIKPSDTVPSIQEPRTEMTLQERLKLIRASITNVSYDVDRDLELFNTRFIVGTKNIVGEYGTHRQKVGQNV